jgi:monoamine oxidase
LASRWIVLPSHGYGDGSNAYGAVVVYNWGNDAAKWQGITDEERIDRALTDLENIYSSLWKPGVNFSIREHFTGQFKVQDWTDEPVFGLSMFRPN